MDTTRRTAVNNMVMTVWRMTKTTTEYRLYNGISINIPLEIKYETNKLILRKNEVIIMKNATLFQVTNNEDFSQNMMGWMYGYVPVCKLQAVYTYVFDATNGISDIDICESVFRLGNTDGEGREYMHYSVSVGDVVNVGCEWYRCTGDGWDCITGKEQGAVGMYIKEREGVSLEYFTEETKTVKEEMEESNMETTANNATINNTTVQEETGMNETIILNGTEEERIAMAQADVVEDAGKVMGTFGKIYKGLKNGKKCISRTKGKVMEDINDDMETIKGGIGTVVGLLDIVGITSLKTNIERIIYAGVSNAGAGKAGSLTNMAEECTAIIYEEIEFLKLIGDEASLKQAASLKAFITKDGKQVRGKNIFELIAGLLYWLVRKVMNKMKEWFGIPKDKMPKVLGMLFSGITMLLDLVLAGVRIVLFLGARAIGFVVAAGVKLGMFVVNTVKTIFGKIKGFTQQVSDSLDNITEEEDDDFFADDEEGYIF